MINTVVLNVRGINTQGVMERLKILKKIHLLSITSIVHPFAHKVNMMNFKIQLGMDNVVINYNGKILLFWNGNMTLMLGMKTRNKLPVNLIIISYQINLPLPLYMFNVKNT